MRLLGGVGLALLVGACGANSRSQAEATVPQGLATASASSNVSPPSRLERGVPACRIANGSDGIVEEAVRLVLDVHRRNNPAAVLPEVSIGHAATSGDAVSFLTVRDGRSGAIDEKGCPIGPSDAAKGSSLDRLSVDGVCSVRGRLVRCAEGAIAALQAGEMAISPGLLFVIAHELGHVLLGHTGSFVERVPVVDLSAPRQEKSRLLAELCARDLDVLEAERQADQFAQETAAALFAQPPFLEPPIGEAGSVALRGRQIALGVDALVSWNVRRMGGQNAAPIALTKDSVCSLLKATHGVARLPIARGTHPSGPQRIADLTARMTIVSSTLSRGSLSAPQDPGADVGNLSDLVADFGAIAAKVDEEEATVREASLDAFCKKAYAAEASPSHCQ